MRTEHLDNKINELETLRSRGELTYIGGEMLSEFKEIKRALNIANVVGSAAELCRCSNKRSKELRDEAIKNVWNITE